MNGGADAPRPIFRVMAGSIVPGDFHRLDLQRIVHLGTLHRYDTRCATADGTLFTRAVLVGGRQRADVDLISDLCRIADPRHAYRSASARDPARPRGRLWAWWLGDSDGYRENQRDDRAACWQNTHSHTSGPLLTERLGQPPPAARPDSRGSATAAQLRSEPGKYRAQEITFARPGSGTRTRMGRPERMLFDTATAAASAAP